MYSIHAMTCGIVVPVIYGLLSSKKTRLYKKFFDKCEETTKMKFLHRKVILLSDFEVCFFQFLDEQVLKKTCLFHYCQSLWRKAQELSQIEYLKKGEFYELVRCLMVLPLVKIERVLDLFLLLKELYTNDIEKKMICYFESNYISGRYKMDYWNLYKISVRCNNFVESFHAMINKFIDVCHPSLHKFIRELYSIIEKERLNVFEVIVKHNLRRDKKEEITKNKQLETIMSGEGKYGDADLLIVLKNTCRVVEQNFEDDFTECITEGESGRMTETNPMEIVISDDDESNEENGNGMICDEGLKEMNEAVVICDDYLDEENEITMNCDKDFEKHSNGVMDCDKEMQQDNEMMTNGENELEMEPVIITYNVYDPSKIVDFERKEEYSADDIHERCDSSGNSTDESTNQALGSKRIKVHSDKRKKATKRKKRAKKTLNQKMKEFVERDIDDNEF